MYVKMAGFKNGRIMRFLFATGVVVLTIFVYASYYSNASIEMSSHIRTSPAFLSSPLSSTMSGKFLKNSLSNSNGIVLTKYVINKNNYNSILRNDIKENKHSILNLRIFNNSNDKFQHLNQNNFINGSTYTDLGQNFYEENSIFFNNSPLGIQKIDATLIPTANIQTFIPDADKILKNLTSTNINQQQQKKCKQEENITKSVVQSSLAQAPSVLILANRMKLSSGMQAGSGNLMQGILTKEIYESGHLDVSPLICPDEGEGFKLLIIITSAHSHQEARLSIRQTWGHYGTRRDVAIAFILGRTNNQTLEKAINQENYIYGDLIRGQFIDSYNNLTLKTISALEWVDQNCPHAKFVLKTDDDMFINVPKLMAFLSKHQKDKRVIYGRLAKKWKPIRNKKSKYYVSSGQFAATIFPPFTTGPAYVMSSDVIHDLYIKSLEQTYLKLEDVFTTGIVAQQLGIKRIHVNEFLNRRIAFNPCNIRKTISVHMIKSNEQFDLWKKLLDQSTNCK